MNRSLISGRTLARLTGELAERIAAVYVQLHGYRVIARNYTCRSGELDIVAQRRGLIAIVEVRFRSRGAWLDGLASVDENKQIRLSRATAEFVHRHPSYKFHQIRFDVISIGRRNYRPHLRPTIRWTKNAFTPSFQNLS